MSPNPSSPGSHFKEHCTVKTLNAGGSMNTAWCLAYAFIGNALYVGYGVTNFANQSQTLAMYQGMRRVGTMTIAPTPCDGHTACLVQEYVTVTHD